MRFAKLLNNLMKKLFCLHATYDFERQTVTGHLPSKPEISLETVGYLNFPSTNSLLNLIF